MSEALWRPSSERIEAAAMTAFSRAAERASGRPLSDYFALHAWSVEESEAFWGLYARHAALPLRSPPLRIRSDDPMPDTRWFEGATLNYAEALLQSPAVRDPGQLALLALCEDGSERRLSFAELRSMVARAAASLRSAGVGPGDRVAAFAANVPETVALLLACAACGAVFSSCSPDFGLEGAQARFEQIRPRLLFASTAYRYGGRRFDTSRTAVALAAALGLPPPVALPYPAEPAAQGLTPWDEWLDGAALEVEATALPFDHPLCILFSSGTTGAPKALIHRAGGALLQHHKEHALHCDIRAGDLVLYYSTTGWMMWNWLVSALAQGAAVVLYEGSPVYPDALALWRAAARHGVTFFGTSARYLHSLRTLRASPKRHGLDALRTVASTGSPLSAAGFEYVYREVKADVHLASISGGTDIVSCFMLGVPTLPVYGGQIQGPGLGVDLAVYDSRGRPVLGRPGELVCRQPLPSMPLGLCNDPSRRRYLETYFTTFPGVWRHGDLVERTAQGGVRVFGRSDATLNPGGVRIGTAELYRPLESLPEVIEAAAVGRREADDERIWLFVVLAPGAVLDEELEGRIRERIRSAASPRHVPQRVLAVSALPRTRSGKVMELAVAAVVNGLPPAGGAAVANPEALAEIEAAVQGASRRGGRG